MDDKKNKATVDAEKLYPGAAVDTGDNDKVDPALVKERTRTENNNPRNNDIDC